MGYRTIGLTAFRARRQAMHSEHREPGQCIRGRDFRQFVDCETFRTVIGKAHRLPLPARRSTVATMPT